MTVTRQVGTTSPVVRVLILTLAVLAVFAVTAFAIALLLPWFQGTPLGHPRTIALSVICALITWLFIAHFHVRNHSVALPFQDRRQLLDSIKTHLGELGYDLKAETYTSLSFTPAFHSRLFGGGITVETDVTHARIVGPKVYLERLHKRLHNQSFLEPLQKSLAGSRKVMP